MTKTNETIKINPKSQYYLNNQKNQLMRVITNDDGMTAQITAYRNIATEKWESYNTRRVPITSVAEEKILSEGFAEIQIDRIELISGTCQLIIK